MGVQTIKIGQLVEDLLTCIDALELYADARNWELDTADVSRVFCFEDTQKIGHDKIAGKTARKALAEITKEQ